MKQGVFVTAKQTDLIIKKDDVHFWLLTLTVFIRILLVYCSIPDCMITITCMHHEYGKLVVLYLYLYVNIVSTRIIKVCQAFRYITICACNVHGIMILSGVDIMSSYVFCLMQTQIIIIYN